MSWRQGLIQVGRLFWWVKTSSFWDFFFNLLGFFKKKIPNPLKFSVHTKKIQPLPPWKISGYAPGWRRLKKCSLVPDTQTFHKEQGPVSRDTLSYLPLGKGTPGSPRNWPQTSIMDVNNFNLHKAHLKNAL